MSRTAIAIALGLSCACTAHAGFTTIDFSTDDVGAILSNGQDIASPDEFGTIVSISSSGGNAGAAIFDSDPAGPNASAQDQDLLVGLGNILILQNSSSATQTTPGFFDVPNDSGSGGRLFFDFTSPTELISIDLVDVDAGNMMILTLTDSLGLSRTYSVGNMWTNEVNVMGDGFDTLDLTTLASQIGEGGGVATAMEDDGFDASSVSQLEIRIVGSGGVDNLTFVPTPGSMALLGVAGVASMRRKR